MKIDGDHPMARKIQIVDFLGNPVPYVHSFDTETKEAELYIPNGGTGLNKFVVIKDESDDAKSGTVLLVSTKLPGATVVHKETGEPMELIPEEPQAKENP